MKLGVPAQLFPIFLSPPRMAKQKPLAPAIVDFSGFRGFFRFFSLFSFLLFFMQYYSRRLLRKARRTGILHSQPRRTAAETLYRQRQGGLLFRQPQDQRRRPERRRLPAWFKMQDRATRNPAILWAARQIRQAQEMPGFPTLAEIRQTALFCTTAWQTSGAARLPLPTIQRGIQAGRKIPRTAKIFLSGIARQAADRPCKTGRQAQEHYVPVRQKSAGRHGRQSRTAGLCGSPVHWKAGRARAVPTVCGRVQTGRKPLRLGNVCLYRKLKK